LIQFDVFVGFDGMIPTASWFPVVCEIKNDGPGFTGTIELTGGMHNQGQLRRLTVELPTGTLKRVILPLFSEGGYSSWDVRLLDERGKSRAEQLGLRPRKQVASSVPFAGALTRTPGGVPVIKPTLQQGQGQLSDLQPAAARLLPAIFPDNPLVLEGLSAIYLSSEKASELSANQVNALLAWLHAGGHLIVGLEQIADVTSTSWLENLMPCVPGELRPLARHPELQEWLGAGSASAQWQEEPAPRAARSRNPPRSRPAVTPGNPFAETPMDPAFEVVEMLAASSVLRDGRAVVSSALGPLMVTADRGLGRVTALMFSPEREPFRSWKNLPTFWARLLDVPMAWYISSDFVHPGGWSSDGIFGAMVDSRQVNKLPVHWLLLLLLVYLVVIGPLDQFWLKRINKPMLTWITFPCYVAAFSLLIYFIGYKLRAGESEWNELNVVDVLASRDRAELRGRTYSSVYSPANQRYSLRSDLRFATFRNDFAGTWGGAPGGDRIRVEQTGDTFKAEVFVPVWSSQLYVSDWWQPAPIPLSVTVTPREDGWRVEVENRTDRPIDYSQIAIDGYLISLGALPPRQKAGFDVSRAQGVRVRDFVTRHGQRFGQAVQSRQYAFGEAQSGRIDDLPNASVAASFLRQMSQQQPYMSAFLSPPGLDLSNAVDERRGVILAWAPDYSPVKPNHQFTPRRSRTHTLWRVPVTVR
jgi:hypothetical protein